MMARVRNLTIIAGVISVVVNILLFILKFWAGVVVGSVALMADAWHTLSDCISSMVVVVGAKISSKPADKNHPYGHGRAEHIAAIIVGMMLALIGFEFFIKSIEKLQNHEAVNYGTIGLVVTIISIVGKEGMAQFAFWASRRKNSSLLRADAWHHRSDALSSVIILVGILLGPKFWWMDGVLGIIVSLMIFYTSFEILKTDINSLMGTSPKPESEYFIRELVNKTIGDEVFIHHLHFHDYGEHTELSCHIKLPGDMTLNDAHKVCSVIENAIHNETGIFATVHPEPIVNRNV